MLSVCINVKTDRHRLLGWSLWNFGLQSRKTLKFDIWFWGKQCRIKYILDKFQLDAKICVCVRIYKYIYIYIHRIYSLHNGTRIQGACRCFGAYVVSHLIQV